MWGSAVCCALQYAMLTAAVKCGRVDERDAASMQRLQALMCFKKWAAMVEVHCLLLPAA